MKDISSQIENYCNTCIRIDTEHCVTCFFGNVDLGKIDLGSMATYNRAYKLLMIPRPKRQRKESVAVG